jgi:hypothetical protein
MMPTSPTLSLKSLRAEPSRTMIPIVWPQLSDIKENEVIIHTLARPKLGKFTPEDRLA